MTANLAPISALESAEAPKAGAATEDAGNGAKNAVREYSVIETYAAFLLALEDDASVELDDTLTRHLDAVSEAIGFL